ncbi:MAG: tryptophan--tRNA ligase, partial [Solobacterium sp.]|nr:tryptophan--tRNA ligase [Solobacterium sp.]
ANLIQIMSSLQDDRPFEDIEKEFEGKGYGDFKLAVADVVCAKLEEIQKRYCEIIDSDLIETTLKDGADRARAIASVTLDRVQRAIGMEIID